jgi:ferredoxin-NADP reductase
MKLTLESKKEETPGCFSFIFQPESPIIWKAGQFLRYQIDNPNPDDRKVNRYFTIASAPFTQKPMITTRFSPEKGSTFKNDLKNLQPSQTIEATGPFGSFIVDDPSKQYVFIAGGIGITPFHSILLEQGHNNQPINIHLIYANRDDNPVYKSELEALRENNPNFRIDYVIDPERVDGNKLKQLITDSISPIFYISGPKPMVEGVEKALKEELQIPEEKIRTDYFPGYSGI